MLRMFCFRWALFATLVSLFGASHLPLIFKSSQSMLASESTAKVTFHWFANSPQTANKLLNDHESPWLIDWHENRCTIEVFGFLVDSVSPSQIFVFESSRLGLDTEAFRSEIESIQMRLEIIRKHTTGHRCVVLGNRFPAAIVASWIKRGLLDYTESDSDVAHLRSVLTRAAEFSRLIGTKYRKLSQIERRLERLSPNEEAVLKLVLIGEPNKSIADQD
jgi:hypothetical protein